MGKYIPPNYDVLAITKKSRTLGTLIGNRARILNSDAKRNGAKKFMVTAEDIKKLFDEDK